MVDVRSCSTILNVLKRAMGNANTNTKSKFINRDGDRNVKFINGITIDVYRVYIWPYLREVKDIINLRKTCFYLYNDSVLVTQLYTIIDNYIRSAYTPLPKRINCSIEDKYFYLKLLDADRLYCNAFGLTRYSDNRLLIDVINAHSHSHSNSNIPKKYKMGFLNRLSCFKLVNDHTNHTFVFDIPHNYPL
jgi:hypothetical protein